MIGHWVVPDPANLWQRLRGRTSALALSKDPRLLVPLWLGVAPTVAGLFSKDAPLVGAVVSTERGPELLAAVSLESERELRAALTTGSQAPYRAREAGSVIVLEPRAPEPGTPALALSFGHLVVGPRPEVVTRIAPYLTQVTAPEERKAPAPRLELGGDRVGAFLSRSLGSWGALAKTWLEERERAARAAHGGRQADVADPRAVIGLIDEQLKALSSALGDAKRVSVTVIDDPSAGFELAIEFTPGSPTVDALKALPGIDQAPLVGPSSHAPFVVVLPLGSETWAGAAAALSNVLGLHREAPEAHGLLASLGRAADDCMGGPLTVAHVRADEHTAVVVRSEACSEAGLDAVMGQLHECLSQPVFMRVLSRMLGGRAVVARKGRRLSIDAPATERVVKWSFRDSVATVVLASDEGAGAVEWATERFDRAGAFPAARLAPDGEPLLLGAAVLLGAPGAGSEGWATLTVRRTDHAVRARLEMEPPALKALSTWFELPDMLQEP